MIIATAGHVDHGKTRLVAALTGVDTDTLAEEKRRGLTIDLGFAYLPREDQLPIGLIDVPGHDRFIRNALCGLSSANHILLVIAADEGPAAQTLEHLSIITLLAHREVTVAITKIDRVDSRRLVAVRAEIDSLLKSTPLAFAPRLEVSAATGHGIDELRNRLLDIAHRELATASADGLPGVNPENFRLAVDRAFLVRGAGLVATGTVSSGTINVGDIVRVASVETGKHREARVRGLRTHDRSALTAHPGQRCALNLTGPHIDKDAVQRGSWVTASTVAAPVFRFDVRLTIPADAIRSFTHWTPVHIHLAASETIARVALLGAREVPPGGSCLAQIVARDPLGVVYGDRFIIRDQSARWTLGGGHAIDIDPPERRRGSPGRIRWLEAMDHADSSSAFDQLLETSDVGVGLASFASNRNLTSDAATRLFENAGIQTVALAGQATAFKPEHWEFIRNQIIKVVADRRLSNEGDNLSGVSTLQGLLQPSVPRLVLEGLVAHMIDSGVLTTGNNGLRRTVDSVTLDARDQQVWESITRYLSNTGLKPVPISELGDQTGINPKELRALLGRASKLGLVVHLSPTLVVLPDTFRMLFDHAQRLDQEAGQIAVAAFRDATGIGRNRSIDVLEFFDARGMTVRTANTRHVRSAADDAMKKLLA